MKKKIRNFYKFTLTRVLLKIVKKKLNIKLLKTKQRKRKGVLNLNNHPKMNKFNPQLILLHFTVRQILMTISDPLLFQKSRNKKKIQMKKK